MTTLGIEEFFWETVMTSRRRFLRSSIVTTVGLCVVVTNKRSDAVEPVERTKNARLKLSLAAYSLRKFLQREPGTRGAMDLAGFVDYCASLGLEGTELTQYYFPQTVTDDYLFGLRRRAHLAGVDITGGAIGNKFTLNPGPALDEQVAYTKTWIGHYAKLGVPVIRVFAGKPPEGISEDAAIDRAVPLLQQACDFAAKHGVMLAIENHDFTTKVDRLLRIVEAVDSPWFGVNFDSGNLGFSTDPYADMQRLAPYAINAQIKVAIRTADGHVTADLERIVQILRDAEYSGYLVLEYEEDEDPFQAIPVYVDRLRRLI